MWNAILITIYIVVFIGGVCGVIHMSFLLVKMNTLSVTTTAIVNLVAIHTLFLGTIPFRLYYYITRNWIFSQLFCKFVSAMVHFHMYHTFLFYVFILVTRCFVFFQRKDKVEFYRNLHAVATSTAVWVLGISIGLPVMIFWYGNTGKYENNTCFQFQQEFEKDSVKAVNYTLISLMVAVTGILLGLHIFMVLKVVKRISGPVWSHQEFRAQLKSLGFVAVIILCFLPHHFFRIYYVQNVSDRHDPQMYTYNEIFLSITAISSLDLFLFALTGNQTLRQKVTALLCC
ncbi:probable G-protein coupled receptor 141 [Candoia aspera]|uniref:probable G-protein coupled receptor 141 n=1 Tax=Candoia aspera TaxID=51853 RepID=UPI002FD82C7C